MFAIREKMLTPTILSYCCCLSLNREINIKCNYNVGYCINISDGMLLLYSITILSISIFNLNEFNTSTMLILCYLHILQVS